MCWIIRTRNNPYPSLSDSYPSFRPSSAVSSFGRAAPRCRLLLRPRRLSLVSPPPDRPLPSPRRICYRPKVNMSAVEAKIFQFLKIVGVGFKARSEEEGCKLFLKPTAMRCSSMCNQQSVSSASKTMSSAALA